MDGERRRIGIADSYLGCARQPANEQSEWAIPVRRWRILQNVDQNI